MSQDQRIAAGATAIQSGHDTIIHQGVSPAQMKQIIETVAAQVPVYAAIARDIVDARLADFEELIIGRFEDNAQARTEAFKDPDFQYLLGRAQHAFARSGEADIGSLLADLIVERSKSKQRDRLALTLNQAVEVAATLTINEYAELALCYVFSRTKQHGAQSLPDFYKTLNESINPYIDDISMSLSSYSYLEAQRCANVGMMMSDFRELLVENYPAFFMKGISLEKLKETVPNFNVANKNLIVPALHDSNKLQPNALDKEVWESVAASNELDSSAKDAVWNLAVSSLMNKDEIISAFEVSVPRIGDAFDVWEKTSIHSLQLTSIGIAIGHAYATKSGFNADLSIWIN